MNIENQPTYSDEDISKALGIPYAEVIDTNIVNANEVMGTLYCNGGLSVTNEMTTAIRFDLGVNDSIIGLALDESGNELMETILDPQFVKRYFEAQKLADDIYTQIEEAKAIIKRFIEEHSGESFTSNGMSVKYTPATTTTTLDSTKIKTKYPDIAAECSKVSPRKSSISIKEEE